MGFSSGVILCGLGSLLVCTNLALRVCGRQASAQSPQPLPCHVESIDFEGWRALQLSNSWVKLIMVPQLGGHRPGDDHKPILLAYDLESDKPVWRHRQVGNGHGFAGTMTTKGGLVFFGDDAQSFEAVDARTGAPLWHFDTGQNLHASPMSYAVNSTQYIVIAK